MDRKAMEARQDLKEIIRGAVQQHLVFLGIDNPEEDDELDEVSPVVVACDHVRETLVGHDQYETLSKKAREILAIIHEVEIEMLEDQDE
jgi:hypothetical protein